MKRREFIRYSGLGLGALSLMGAPTLALEQMADTSRAKRRIVVVGGGFGGATAARYSRMIDAGAEVILVERHDRYISCPMSNWVIGGLKEMAGITFDYRKLAGEGIRVVHAEVVGLNAPGRYLETTGEKIPYDRLIVAPGIAFRYERIEGLDEEARRIMPHAYQAGPQTQQLRDELLAMKAGGTVLLTVPESPYRCPPGPYERVSLIADFLKKHKPGSRIVVLDPHPDIASKGKLFHQAWDDLYRDIIQYVPDVGIAKVDAGKRLVSTFDRDYAGEVINLIPDQKAGDLAFALGLVPDGKLWAPVNPLTFESTLVPGVHVVGDATDAATSGPMPKSAFVANSMGKVAAFAVAALLDGRQPPRPTFANSCYSMVNDREAIYITGVFEYDEASGANVAVKAAGDTSPGRAEYYGRCAQDWANSIWADTLGYEAVLDSGGFVTNTPAESGRDRSGP